MKVTLLQMIMRCAGNSVRAKREDYANVRHRKSVLQAERLNDKLVCQMLAILSSFRRETQPLS